jgi:hypothetical protein
MAKQLNSDSEGGNITKFLFFKVSVESHELKERVDKNIKAIISGLNFSIVGQCTSKRYRSIAIFVLNEVYSKN